MQKNTKNDNKESKLNKLYNRLNESLKNEKEIKKKNISFFVRFKRAIFNVEKYDKFATEKLSIGIKYFFKLVFALSIILSIFATYKAYMSAMNVISLGYEALPDFTLSQNVLVSNEKVDVLKENNNGVVKVIVDTEASNDSEEVKTYLEEMSIVPNAVMLLNDRLYLKIDGIINPVSYEYKVFDLGDNEINKESITTFLSSSDMSSLLIASLITMFIYLFLTYLISVFLDIIVISLITYLTSRIIGIKMKYNSSVSIAIYSISLSVLLTAIYTPINILTGFNIEYFSILYTIIPYIYVITALLMIRSDLIKQKMEVGKVKKIEEEIKEEEERKKAEKEREEELNKKNKKDDETKKEKKKDKKDSLGNKAPEGQEA